MKKRIALIIGAIFALALMAACGKKPEPEPEPVETTTSFIDEYSPFSVQANTTKQVVKTVKLEINPSFTMGLDNNNKVIAITAENLDAFVVLSDLGEYFPDTTDGVELKYVMRDVALATARSELDIQEYSMEVSVDGEIPELVVQEACREAAADVYEEKNMEVSCHCEDMNIDFVVNEENIDDIRLPICVLCGGTGWEDPCTECGGTGEVIRVEKHTERVRNDYVCPVCGGKGWVDDGMHGGQTAECGNCTTNGGNGEWNQLAYDEVEVEEEFHDTCPRCGGNGKVPCEGCNGTGVLAPPEE